MSKYVDVEKFIADRKELYCNDCEMRKSNGKTVYDIGEVPCKSCGIFDTLNDLEDYPAADVQEVKHAIWKCVNESENIYMCVGENGCGYEILISTEGTPLDNDMIFCPHCGAKMDGKGYQPKQKAENNEESYYSTALKIACIILEKETNFIKEYGKLPQIVILNGFQKETLTTEYGEDEYFYSSKKLDYFCGLKILTSPQINEAGDIEVR